MTGEAHAAMAESLISDSRSRAAEMMDGLRESQSWRDGAMVLALVSELRATRDRLAEQRAENEKLLADNAELQHDLGVVQADAIDQRHLLQRQAAEYERRIAGQATTISTLGQVAAEASRVMDALKAHGPGIVGHLLDTDDNAGERLRQLLREVSLWALRDGTSWKERAESAEAERDPSATPGRRSTSEDIATGLRRDQRQVRHCGRPDGAHDLPWCDQGCRCS
jgi:uncharacterized coiled-coil protein SlyX